VGAQVGIGHGAIVGQAGASWQIIRAQRQAPRALMGVAILGRPMAARPDGGGLPLKPARRANCYAEQASGAVLRCSTLAFSSLIDRLFDGASESAR
jgi:hypothetical protein